MIPAERTEDESIAENTKRILCTFEGCGKEFPSISKLNRHVGVHTGKTHVCKECVKCFIRSEHLRRHSVIHTESAETHPCSYEGCTKRFIHRSHLLRHIKTHTKGFFCETCGASFGKACQLRKHQQKHLQALKSTSASYVCDFDDDCGACFESYEGLKKHMNAHKEQKTYQCLQCDTKYFRFSDLVSHRKEMHKTVHKCEKCSKTFVRLSRLKHHIETVHGNAEPELFICTYKDCLQSFATKGNLGTHYKAVHLGLKPFKCEICSANFSMKHVLKRHIICKHRNEEGMSAPAKICLENDLLQTTTVY